MGGIIQHSTPTYTLHLNSPLRSSALIELAAALTVGDVSLKFVQFGKAL